MIRVGDEIELSWREGLTVEDLLRDVPDGPHCAAVRVNGRIVARPLYTRTLVPDGAQVHLVPMIAGG